MHAPASIVVGMMYSSGVLAVIAGIRYSSLTLNRPEDAKGSYMYALLKLKLLTYHVF